MPPQNPYQFRGNRQAQTALGYSRLQFQEMEAEMRERLAFGKHLLEQAQFANKVQQEEYKVQHELIKQKSIAAAGRRVNELNPTSETWAADYAKIMTDFPYAHDDKFLQENFQAQSKVHSAALAAKVNNSDHISKAGLALAMEGIDISKDTKYDDAGNPVQTDWAAIASKKKQAKDAEIKFAADKAGAIEGAKAEAKKGIQTPGVIEKKAKLAGVLSDGQANLSNIESSMGALEPSDKEGRETLNKAWNSQNAANIGATTELGELQKAFPDQQSAPAQQAPPAPSATPAPTPAAPPSNRPPLDEIFGK